MTRAIAGRLRRLEGGSSSDAAIYLAETDGLAARLVSRINGSQGTPLVIVTGEAQHSPPVRRCSVYEMLSQVALRGRAIHDPHQGLVSPWRLWRRPVQGERDAG